MQHLCIFANSKEVVQIRSHTFSSTCRQPNDTCHVQLFHLGELIPTSVDGSAGISGLFHHKEYPIWLVVDPNSSEKYAKVKLDHFPNFRDENNKNIWDHQPAIYR